MTETKYYLITTKREDYEVDKNNEFSFVGFPDRNRKTVFQMEKGDKIVFYIAGRQTFSAIVEVVGDPYYSNTKVWNDEIDYYPSRVPTKPLIFVDNPKDGVYIKDIWDNLSFIVKTKKWGSQVMSSLRRIPEDDYCQIEKSMEGLVR